MKLIKWLIAGGLLAVCLSSTTVFADCSGLYEVCNDLCVADVQLCYSKADWSSGKEEECKAEYDACDRRCKAEEKRCQILSKSEEDPCDRTTPEEN